MLGDPMYCWLPQKLLSCGKMSSDLLEAILKSHSALQVAVLFLEWFQPRLRQVIIAGLVAEIGTKKRWLATCK